MGNGNMAGVGYGHLTSKDLVFLTPITPSNVNPLTGAPGGPFYSFYCATIQFLRSRTTQPQTSFGTSSNYTLTHTRTHTHVLRQRRGQGETETEARQRRGRGRVKGCVAQGEPGEASALYKYYSTRVLVKSRQTTETARAHTYNTYCSLDLQMRAFLRNIARLNMSAANALWHERTSIFVLSTRELHRLVRRLFDRNPFSERSSWG